MCCIRLCASASSLKQLGIIRTPLEGAVEVESPRSPKAAGTLQKGGTERI